MTRDDFDYFSIGFNEFLGLDPLFGLGGTHGANCHYYWIYDQVREVALLRSRFPASRRREDHYFLREAATVHDMIRETDHLPAQVAPSLPQTRLVSAKSFARFGTNMKGLNTGAWKYMREEPAPGPKENLFIAPYKKGQAIVDQARGGVKFGLVYRLDMLAGTVEEIYVFDDPIDAENCQHLADLGGASTQT